MLSVGVMGKEEVDEIIFLLKNFFEVNDLEVMLHKESILDKQLNVLILSALAEESAQAVSRLEQKDVLIINSDHKEIFRAIKGAKPRLISYGLNSKATVTTSSVGQSESTHLLCCVQRSFPTLSGKTVTEQEIPVKLNERVENSLSLLAAITGALICDARYF